MPKENYKDLIDKKINTKFGPAIIISVSGKYGSLSYEEVDGIGFVDLSDNLDYLSGAENEK